MINGMSMIKVINEFGTVAHSLGFKRNKFNTAESRLSAFYDEVGDVAHPPGLIAELSVAFQHLPVSLCPTS